MTDLADTPSMQRYDLEHPAHSGAWETPIPSVCTTVELSGDTDAIDLSAHAHTVTWSHPRRCSVVNRLSRPPLDDGIRQAEARLCEIVQLRERAAGAIPANSSELHAREE
jgi:hypothetical protein